MNSDVMMLDANIPMYAAGSSHDYKQPCGWVMAEIANGRLDAAIDTEIVQEILYRLGGNQRWAIGIEMARHLLAIVPTVYGVSQADAILCVQLCEQYGPRGLSARDLLHVAVMRNHGLNTIISTDADFDRVDGITRLDPKTFVDRLHKRIKT